MQHRHHLFYILLLSLFLAHPAHRLSIIPEAVVQVLTLGIEAQVPSVEERVPRSRPIVAFRAHPAHGRIDAAIGGGEEHRVPVDL